MLTNFFYRGATIQDLVREFFDSIKLRKRSLVHFILYPKYEAPNIEELVDIVDKK